MTSTAAAEATETWDVIVLGAGSTGENVADRAVKGGLTAVVVEADLVGGDCSYWACMPSKALLRPGHALHEAQAVPGVPVPPDARLDVEPVLARRDAFASRWDDDGQVRWLGSAHIDLIRGHGRLAGERRVEVDTGDGVRALTARHAVVLATGSKAALPPVPGLTEARPWTTKEATSAKQPPARLIVLGGGVAGSELAQAWASLGSRVTLLEGLDRLLPKVEPFAGELLADSLRAQGVDVRTATTVTAVSRADENGPVTVTLEGGESIEGDDLLVATGRVARTDDVGLETVGLAPGAWIEVDDSMQASAVPGGWLYAAGDVNGRVLLTHQGKYQARVAGDVIAARAKGEAADPPAWSRYAATADHAAIPQVVFTDPEVAAVGLSEADARAAGHPVDVAEYELGHVAGAALFVNGYTGRAKIVIDRDRRVLLGATFVGPGAGELLQAATIAVVGEVPLDRLWHAVPSYPTISEIWLRLLEAYGL
jgi:pyruvate/2-oxoglutarate dehydrogenase complex dihydrolipoamide dehydrogenase (E3) component